MEPGLELDPTCIQHCASCAFLAWFVHLFTRPCGVQGWVPVAPAPGTGTTTGMIMLEKGTEQLQQTTSHQQLGVKEVPPHTPEPTKRPPQGACEESNQTAGNATSGHGPTRLHGQFCFVHQPNDAPHPRGGMYGQPTPWSTLAHHRSGRRKANEKDPPPLPSHPDTGTPSSPLVFSLGCGVPSVSEYVPQAIES
jgi:hypothetical protein|uniref:Uncharacterized protein n=1 Tax=Eutreptiella gymnastica TaxID=73025 RepID=A0A7S4CWK9_9EUGL